jgi:hypothetical protein
MPSLSLTPNATLNTGSESVTGAATHDAALADESDASYVSAYFTNGRLAMSDTAIPAGAVVWRIRANVRSRDDLAGNDSQNGSVQIIIFPDSGGTSLLFQTGPTHTNQSATWVDWNTNWVTQNFDQSQLNAITVGWSIGTAWRAQMARLRIEAEYANAPGAPTGVGPSGAITTTRRPTASWTHVPGAGALSGQSHFQVRIFSQAQYSAGGFDPATSSATADSGQVAGAGTTWLVNTNLANGTNYRAYVRTWQTTQGVQQVSPFAFSSFNIAIVVPTPTAVTPASGTTVTSSKPAVGASTGPMTDNVLVRRQWQVASDSGFTTALQTVDTDTVAAAKSGTITWPALLNRLAQGTWWIRARTVDEYGQTSAYTAGTSFTVAHQPSTTNRQPSGGSSSTYDTVNNDVDVSWTFSDIDTDDFQLKYEAELWKLSDPVGSLKTTGQVTSGIGAATFTALNATWKDVELRWRVRVADQDNVWSAWSPDQAFFLRDAPVPTITVPTQGGTVNSPTPTITWTFSATGGRTQASYRVIVSDTDASTVVADSGVLPGTALTWTVPTPVILVGPDYQVQVIVVDSTGLSATDTNDFTATYVAPTTPVFTLDGTDFEEQGRVLVDWSTAEADPTLLAWRIYRRIWGYATWQLVAEVDSTVRVYYDYLAPSQTRVEYAVVQVAESFGDPVESGYPIEEFEGVSTGYFLVVPEDDAYNLKLEHVTGDTFEDEQEMATLNLIGRGRRVEYGTRYGQTGTLTGAFYDTPEGVSARTQRLFLEAIRDSQLKVYLRTPFGDVWAVAMPSAQITRIPGTGLVERTTFSLSYTEITA